MKMEKTLVVIKPDAIVKRIIGKLISFIEKHNFKIVACKMVYLSEEKARKFYIEHKGKDFYHPLVKFMSSNPCVVMVVYGRGVISKMRRLIGNTDPNIARKGTIRYQFASDNRHNCIHSSCDRVSAKKEINFFFKPNEIFIWKKKKYKKLGYKLRRLEKTSPCKTYSFITPNIMKE